MTCHIIQVLGVFKMNMPPRKLPKIIFEFSVLILGECLKVYLSLRKLRMSFLYIRINNVFSTM